MKPTIYLSNAASKGTPGHHGPGRMLCAMAKPRRWEIGAGRCHAAMPHRSALEGVQSGRLTVAAYRELCEAAFKLREADPNCYLSGALTFTRPGGEIAPVMHGDTLICGCARWEPGKARTHPCHLELLAPFLARAGWEVVLWGQRWTYDIGDPDDADGGWGVYNSLCERFSAESFGWPALEGM